MFQLIVHQQEKLERKPIFCFFDNLGNIQLFIDFHPVSTLDAILFYKVVCTCFRTRHQHRFSMFHTKIQIHILLGRRYQIDYIKIQSKYRGYPCPFIFNGQSHGKKEFIDLTLLTKNRIKIYVGASSFNNFDFGRQFTLKDYDLI